MPNLNVALEWALPMLGMAALMASIFIPAMYDARDPRLTRTARQRSGAKVDVAPAPVQTGEDIGIAAITSGLASGIGGSVVPFPKKNVVAHAGDAVKPFPEPFPEPLGAPFEAAPLNDGDLLDTDGMNADQLLSMATIMASIRAISDPITDRKIIKSRIDQMNADLAVRGRHYFGDQRLTMLDDISADPDEPVAEDEMGFPVFRADLDRAARAQMNNEPDLRLEATSSIPDAALGDEVARFISAEPPREAGKQKVKRGAHLRLVVSN